SIPVDVKPGKYYLGVLVDPENVVTEEHPDGARHWKSLPVMVTQNTWTVLAYIDGDNDLFSSMVGLLSQLGQVNTTGSGPVTIMAMIDSPTGVTARGKVTYQHDSIPDMEQLGDLNMGAPTTLSDFINWGVQQAPAQHYEVIIADHGSMGA